LEGAPVSRLFTGHAWSKRRRWGSTAPAANRLGGFCHAAGNRQPRLERGRRGTTSCARASHMSGVGVGRQRLDRRGVAPARFTQHTRLAGEQGRRAHSIWGKIFALMRGATEGEERLPRGVARVAGEWVMRVRFAGPAR
jgi:hypothetical protein